MEIHSTVTIGTKGLKMKFLGSENKVQILGSAHLVLTKEEIKSIKWYMDNPSWAEFDEER